MNVVTNFVLEQFIGGRALFWGIAVCLLGCGIPFLASGKRGRLISRIMALAGAVLVAFSSAPFPVWTYAIFFALLFIVVFRPGPIGMPPGKPARLLMLLLTATSVLMILHELRQSKTPKIPFQPNETLLVIGDSISIGADPPGKTWPEIVGDLAPLGIRNLSFAGAKVATSMDSVQNLKESDTLILLELGGNDLLGGTPTAEFRENLDRMLTYACNSRRRVVMLELPLPPLYNRFGAVQRQLAAKHGVTLIPKRYFAKVICTPGATVDGLHLSNRGHELLAQALFQMFEPAP